MKTIDEICRELFSKPKDWDYYQENGDGFVYPFESDDYRLCSEFIKTFFRIAGKEANTFRDFADKLGKRSQHVVSTFFLGIYLYKNSSYIHNMVHKELQKKYPKGFSDNEIDRDFTFVWFLISLFHDMGYLIEEDKIDQKPKYSSFKDFLASECKNKKLRNFSGVPEFYSGIYKPYFKYRIKEQQINDHGICGAFLLFKNLYEIRKRKVEKPEPDDKLCWDKFLIEIYNFASWIILAHNIWYANCNHQDKVAEYNYYKLNKLIRANDEYKIKFEEYPMLFLFCLIDSIEFLKKIKNIALLGKIELGIENGDNEKCRIVVKPNLTCACNEKVLGSIKDLNTWLTTTTEVEDKAIKIDILSQ